ncbi:hypothetical protein OSB04_019519 [Centaurea solstitialis]|uniref:GDSL esterase/lipase n=1 Tax=Centaurea solstitialis TaxID=347529 RepID=A0AA38T3Z2_9ASTR|nr:hypothetical protein OSB04_019519 [Centaurea solstitialis]
MATSICFVFVLLLTCTLHANGCYTSIISFGDSLADTGNAKLLVSEDDMLPHFLFPPYGETYFHEATGRNSNGRLIIDFVAESLGLPLVPPFLGGARNNSDGCVMEFGQGVNYAVAGSFAMDSLISNVGREQQDTSVSLGLQFKWFKRHLPSICGIPSGKCF